MSTTTPLRLDGRCALVTGCGSEAGIGFACAALLARLGARVTITSTTDRIETRAGELRAAGAVVHAHVADLTDREQALALVASAEAAHGPLDVLVNNAGLAQIGVEVGGAHFSHLPEETFRHDLELNPRTAFHVTQAALPGMLERGYGRIVMVSSVTATRSSPRRSSTGYSTAKAAVDGMMRALAHDCARGGITANSVQPGWIATASSTEQELTAGRATPVGRAGHADEVAAAVAFLACEELVHHGTDAGRRRRQHHPGSARGQRLQLSREPGVHPRGDPLDVVGIVEVVADACELVDLDAAQPVEAVARKLILHVVVTAEQQQDGALAGERAQGADEADVQPGRQATGQEPSA